MLQSITVNVPPPIFQRIQSRARHASRTVEEEASSLLTEIIGDSLPPQTEQRLMELEFLTTDELIKVAHVKSKVADEVRMQQLTEKLSRHGLTEGEQHEAQLLADHFNTIMLVRAKAAVLLNQQGMLDYVDLENLS